MGDELIAENAGHPIVVPASVIAAARPASRPPRTPPATATPSACALPLGLPAAFTDPVPRPLEDLVAATPAPTDRSSSDEVADARHRPSARARRAERRSRPTAASCAASSARRRAREWCDATCCASSAGARWPPCGARSSRSSPRRWPGSSRRGTASRRSAAASTPSSRRSACCRAPIVGVDARGRRPRRPGWTTTGRPTSTSCARRASACGSAPAAIGSTTAGSGCASPTSAAAGAGLGGAGASEGRSTTPCATVLAERGASFWTELRGRRAGVAPTTSCSPRCGTSCGPARSPTTRWPRCGRPGLGGAGGRAGAGSPARGGRGPGGSRHRPARRAGRWSLVAPLLEPGPDAHRGRPRRRLQLLERHGVVTREAVLAEGVVGGYASVYGVLKVLEERGQVRRGYFVERASAPPSSPCPAPSTGCGSVRAGRRRPPGRRVPRRSCSPPPIPAQPYGATLAWPESAGRPARTARRWSCCATAARSAWYDRRSHHLVTFPATLDDRSWAEALADLVQGGRCARSRCARSTASRWPASHRSSPRSPPPPRPPATPTATAASRSSPAEAVAQLAVGRCAGRREAGPGQVADLAGDLVGVEVVALLDEAAAGALGQADEGVGEREAVLVVDVGGDQRGDRGGDPGRSPGARPG